MHCLIACPPGAQPGAQLGALLQTWRPQAQTLGASADLDTPFERSLVGAQFGTPLPWGPWAAQASGLQGPAWALLAPLHLQLDAQQARAQHPGALEPAEATAFEALLAPLFPADQGWQLHALAHGRWLLGHAQLAELRVASLARVLNRALTPWLPEARWLRRVQNEAQMLLHEHALNQARAAAGRPTLNSIWIWGAGVASVRPPADAPALQVHDEDADWQALDAGPIAALRRAAAAGKPARLTLAGGARARSWAPARWRWPWAAKADAAAALAALEHFDDTEESAA